jgi:hypothetical protein
VVLKNRLRNPARNPAKKCRVVLIPVFKPF